MAYPFGDPKKASHELFYEKSHDLTPTIATETTVVTEGPNTSEITISEDNECEEVRAARKFAESVWGFVMDNNN